MIDSFDDLYDQIIQCERRVEEKQCLLNECRFYLKESPFVVWYTKRPVVQLFLLCSTVASV